MNTYEQSLYRFKSFRDKCIQHGVLETDLPFLFENKDNKTGILLIHGSQATACNTIELGKYLNEKGYTTLGTLLHGHGLDLNILNNGSVSWKDCYQTVLESFEILKNLVENVFVLGSSFGGSLAYLFGIEYEEDLSGIIAVSAPTYSKAEIPDHNWMKQVYLSIKAVEHNIHKLNLPTLILHSDDDKSVKSKNAIFAYQNIESEQKKLILYNEVGHSLGFGANTYEVANDIYNFIEHYKYSVQVTFEIEYHNAFSVSVAGEFNNWNSKTHKMTNINGKWFLKMYLRPGNYQYKFVINENYWILDPNSEIVYTPLGATNSLKKVD